MSSHDSGGIRGAAPARLPERTLSIDTIHAFADAIARPGAGARMQLDITLDGGVSWLRSCGKVAR